MGEDIAAIKQRIEELRVEHRDLDDIILRLSADPLQDKLQLQRLKKRKLYVKDLLSYYERQLVPDIPA